MRATCSDRLRAAIPPATTRPSNSCAHDERRGGLLTVQRRRLSARGVPPLGSIQPTSQWRYVSGAVAPRTGAPCFLAMPHRTSAHVQVFRDACANAFPDSLHVRVVERSGAHRAHALAVPAKVRVVLLPAASPARNPMERVWRDLNDQRAWQQVVDLATLAASIADLLCAYAAPTLPSRTAYPYVVEAVNALYA